MPRFGELFGALWVVMFLCWVEQVSAQNTITFADTNLEAAVRGTLGKPTGPLTTVDLASLTYLYAYRAHIADLSGLEYATNLTTLSLPYNALSNVTPLAGLAKLQHVDLQGNHLSETHVLAGLGQLLTLNISFNAVQDAGPLLALTNLTSLDIGYNPLANCPVLAGMVHLTGLTLAHLSITDPSFVNGLTNLNSLSLLNNQITTLPPLPGLRNLESLDLSYNPLTNAAALSALTNLTNLTLDYCPLASLAFLQALTQLDYLHLQHNNLGDLSPLAGLTNLSVLEVSGNPITNTAVLGSLTRLTDLFAIGCALTNIEFVSSLARVEVLDLERNRITDLGPVLGLSSLQYLYLDQNRLTNITGLDGLPALRDVSLTQNLLDVSAESPVLTVMTNLQARGVSVSYLPQNQPPSFIIPASWAVPMDRTASLSFYVYDDVTSPTQLVVTVACADTNLVSAAGLILQQVDPYGDWSVTLTPSTGQTGTTTLTLTATDDTGFTAITNLTLTVFYSPPVTIPDTNLEAVVRNTLGLPAGPLTAYDLQSLTYFYASYRSISNLTGLEWASNLSTLDLSGNPVVNWTPLLALTQLQTLNLGGCNLHDLSMVPGLTNLTSLTLDGNPTPNLASLASLPNLTTLSARSCSLSNLAGIGALVHLQSLSLGYNSLSNPASLVALTNLTSLYLDHNPLSGTIGLAGLRSLQNLNLSQCSLSSLSGLHTLTNLQYLYLANNSIRDLSPLAGLTNLSYVSLDSNPVTSLTALAGLPRLTELSVQSCSLSNLVSAQGLTPLQTLYLGNNGIHDLTPLAGLTNLTTLYLGGNSLASGAPLSGLHALGTLDLTACSISDATSLAWLTQLRSLELGYNYLTDISPLAGLTNLSWLVLTGNRLTNISSLQSLTGLRRVDVRRNLLDLSAGSPTMTTITKMQNQGASVHYDPQNQPPTFYSVRTNWIVRPGMAAHTQFALMDDVTLANKVAVTTACSSAGPLSNSVITLVRTSFCLPPVMPPLMPLPAFPLPGPSPSPTPIPIPVQPPLPLGLTRSDAIPGIPIAPFGFNAGVSDWDLAVTPPLNQTGTMTITLTATDDTGLSTNATILVTVATPQPLDGSWLGATNLVWQTGGNAPWFGQTNETCNGSAAAQSGAVEAGDGSWLETTVTGPGILTFWWKLTPVNAYSGAYGSQGSATFTTSRGGTMLLPASNSWQEQRVSIPPGECALDWNYSSYAAASPSNACWLAEVSFVSGMPDFWLDVASSPDWAGSGVTLHGEPGGLYEFQVTTNLANWLPLESVVFDPVNGGFTSYLYDPAARGPRAFYRARQLPATTMWFDPLTFDAIGSPLLRLYSQPGIACEIQASTNLRNWSTLATVTNTTGTVTFTDTQGLPKCFYKARQAP